MATTNAAINYANVARELSVLEYVTRFTPPDFEELRSTAMVEDSKELSRKISATKARIAELRQRYPVARWVDSDPVYRDAHSPWVNSH